MSGTHLRTVILGTGSELPCRVMTNAELERMVDTSDEWITTRTGIKERRILEEGKGNADMAYRAAVRALSDAGITAAVKSKLAGEKISTVTRIDVDTNRGVVALNGTVKTVADKTRAEELARQVKGVRDVVNNLRIQPA